MGKALTKIKNAICTYNSAEGITEVHEIMNAFWHAMQEKEKVYVLTKTIAQKYNEYVILDDGEGHAVFPLFTDIQELLPVKAAIEKDIRLNACIMDLDYVLRFLVEGELCDGIVINPASLNFNMPNPFYEDILDFQPASHITLIHADITDLYTDAIVSPTDEFLSGTGDVDAAIQQAGGAELKEEIREERLGIADVIGTESCGCLHSRLVFFTRPPVYTENMNYRALYDCYYNCMNVAQQAECTSIAFPCIGVGKNGIPMDAVIRISTNAVIDWLSEHEDYVIDVYFCCSRAEDKEKYQNYFDGRA